MCEVQQIRYVHHMEHLQYDETLDVGCICAGYMEENPDAARKRETNLKSRNAREQRQVARRAVWEAAEARRMENLAAWQKQRRENQATVVEHWTTATTEEQRCRTDEKIKQLFRGLENQRRTSKEERQKANPSLCLDLTALRRAIDCPTLTLWESDFANDVVERYTRDDELSLKQKVKAKTIIEKAVRYFKRNQ